MQINHQLRLPTTKVVDLVNAEGFRDRLPRGRTPRNTGVFMRINKERRWTLEMTIQPTEIFKIVL